MSHEQKKQDAAEFFLELADKQGIACSTVSDGHVLIIKQSTLLALLEQCKETGQVMIFIKRPDFNN